MRNAEIGVHDGDGNLVINNVVYGVCYIGIRVQDRASATLVYNNTVDGRGHPSDGGGIFSGGGALNTRVKNNIVTGKANTDPPSEGKAINDCQSGGTECAANLTNSDSAYYQFRNVLNRDYHLTSTSPAKNAGVRLTEVPTDFDGSRGRGPFSGTMMSGPLNTGHNRLAHGRSSR